MWLGATLAVAAILAAGSPGGPAVGAAAGTGSSALPTATYEAGPSAAMIPGDLGWYSSNWAGYAVGGGRHTSVSAQWTVPAVSATARPGYSALWVGIDGFTNDALIQAGTEADFYDGVAHYTAWWEILPAPAVTIHSLSVRAGDRVSVKIARVSAGRCAPIPARPPRRNGSRRRRSWRAAPRGSPSTGRSCSTMPPSTAGTRTSRPTTAAR